LVRQEGESCAAELALGAGEKGVVVRSRDDLAASRSETLLLELVGLGRMVHGRLVQRVREDIFGRKRSPPLQIGDILGSVYPWSILPVPVSVSHTREVKMVRVLVTVEPTLYREALAFAVQRNRPEAEVMIVPEEVMDGQVKDFAPHVLVRNDSDGVVPEGLLDSVVCRVEVLFTDGMAARVSVGASSYTIEDVSMEDLLGLVDEAEGLVSG
jgi:hypothetical protein